MLRSAVKHVAVVAPRIPAQALLTASVTLGFGALLLQDQVPPILVYCLQVFLAS